MTEQAKPILQKPPGYRDPTAPAPPKVPPRNPVLPPSFHPKKKRRNCFQSCCCYTCLFILILIVLIGVTGIFLYLWYEPRVPVFHLQSLQFSVFNITTSPDGPALTSQAVVRIEVRNPNSVLKVNYGRMELDLKAEGVDLGTSTILGFTQPKKNTTVLKFNVQVKNLLIQNGVSNKLKDGFRTKSLVVEAEVRTGVGMGTDGWTTMKPPIKAMCDGVTLREVEGGAVPICKITMFKWINMPN